MKISDEKKVHQMYLSTGNITDIIETRWRVTVVTRVIHSSDFVMHPQVSPKTFKSPLAGPNTK